MLSCIMSKDHRTPGRRRENIRQNNSNKRKTTARKPSGNRKEPGGFFCPAKEVTPMASSVTVQLENLRQLVADVQAIQDGGRKAISNTVKDVKARAPGWIAQEVTAVYNIKKGEIVPSSSGKPKKMAGTIRITGETIEELALTYKGRLLTPVHFGMTPKAPPAGKSYTLKAQILKGSKKVIGRYKNTRTKGGPYSQRSHWILMGTGNTQADGTSWIPFQRMSTTRTDIQKMTTISVPQMITSDRTNEAIMLRLNTETKKRLDHHLKRALGI